MRSNSDIHTVEWCTRNENRETRAGLSDVYDGINVHRSNRATWARGSHNRHFSELEIDTNTGIMVSIV